PRRIRVQPGRQRDFSLLAAFPARLALDGLRTGRRALPPESRAACLYAPVVLFVLAGVVQAVLNLWRPEWTWLPPATGLATSIGGLLVLNSAMKIYPYVSLLDPAANSARYGQVAYGLNIIVLLSLGCVWLGLAIACGVHAFQCFA